MKTRTKYFVLLLTLMVGVKSNACPVWRIGSVVFVDENNKLLNDVIMWTVYENNDSFSRQNSFKNNKTSKSDSISACRFIFYKGGMLSGNVKKYYRIQCEGYADIKINEFNFNYEKFEDGNEYNLPTIYIVLYKKKFIQKGNYFIKYDQYELDIAQATSDSTVIDMTMYTKKLMQESTEATYERILKSKYQSYPNPVQDKMTIEVEDSMPRPFKVRVYDLMGEVVLEEELTEAKMQIDLSATAAGTYFVRIDDDQGEMKHYMKFVKT